MVLGITPRRASRPKCQRSRRQCDRASLGCQDTLEIVECAPSKLRFRRLARVRRIKLTTRRVRATEKPGVSRAVQVPPLSWPARISSAARAKLLVSAGEASPSICST